MQTILNLGGIRIDLDSGRFKGPTGEDRLTPRERDMLVALARQPGRTVPRQELLEAIWGTDDPTSRAPDVTFRRLRQKLELDPSSPRFLLTIFGEGYRLDLPGEMVPAAPQPASPAGVGDKDLIGRQAARDEVRSWVSGPGTWLTITGPGGVGKTRLLHSLAQELRPAFADGVAWVELAGASDATEAMAALAGALGLQLQRKPEPAIQIARALRHSRMLWALDNLEQLGADAQALARVAAACPGVRVLASSRAPVAHLSEALLRLPGLDPQASRDLFLARVQRHRPGWKPDRKEEQALEQLLQATEGLPLAIEIAAATLRQASLEEVRSSLADLQDPARVDRHRSLRAAFEVSWRHLQVSVQESLARLSVFAGPVDEDAAAAVAGATEEDLDRLVEVSLASRSPEGLRLHPLVRSLAEEKLLQRDPTGLTRRRHRAWVLRWLEQMEPRLRGPDPALCARAFDLRSADAYKVLSETRVDRAGELSQVEPALRRILPGRLDVLRWISLFERLQNRFERAGEAEPGARAALLRLCCGERILPVPEQVGIVDALPLERLPAPLARRLRIQHALLLPARGEVEPAIAIARRIGAEAGPDEAETLALAAVVEAFATWAKDRSRDVPPVLQSALDRALAGEDILLAARIHHAFASASLARGDLLSCRHHAERALEISATFGDTAGTLRCLQVLSSVANRLGESDRAEALARQGLAIAPRGSAQLATQQIRLGSALRRRGAYSEAEPLLSAAVGILEANEEWGLLVTALEHLGFVHLLQRQLDPAEACFRRGLEVAPWTGHRLLEATPRGALVQVLMAQGRLDEALSEILRALEDARGDAYIEATLKVTLAEVLERRGDAEACMSKLCEVAAWAAPIRSRPVLNALFVLAALSLARRGEREKALQALAMGTPDPDIEQMAEEVRGLLGIDEDDPGLVTARGQDPVAVLSELGLV